MERCKKPRVPLATFYNIDFAFGRMDAKAHRVKQEAVNGVVIAAAVHGTFQRAMTECAADEMNSKGG